MTGSPKREHFGLEFYSVKESHPLDKFKLVPLLLRNTIFSLSPNKDNCLSSCTDSFHNGGADGGAFEIGFMRLLRMAINELEYIFATIEEEMK